MQADSKGDVDVVKRLVLNTNNIFDLCHKIERLSIKTREVLPLCDTALFEFF